MKKLLTLMAVAAATTIAVTACSNHFDFTERRVNEYKAEFKDADFSTTKHTLTEGFVLETEIKTMREGYVNTAPGNSFWTVFQITKFGTYNTTDLTDWNGFRTSELLVASWSQYLLTSYLPATNKNVDSSKLEKIENPLKNQGEIYLAKIFVDTYSPSTTKQMSMYKKTGEFDVYAWGQPTDGSVEPTAKYPTFDVNSKKMYKLN